MIRTVSSGAQVASLLVSSTSIALSRAEGYYAGANDAYLQFHTAANVAALTSGTSVPLRSFQLQPTSPFSYFWTNVDRLLMTGPVLAVVSSTEAVYTTKTAAGDKVDLFADIEEYAYLIGGLSSSTSGAAAKSQIIWNQVAAPKALYTATIVSAAAYDAYVLVFSTDNPRSNGDIPLASYLVKAGTTVALNYGAIGYSPYNKDSSGTETRGCSLAMSAQAGVFDNTAIGNDFTLTGTYK